MPEPKVAIAASRHMPSWLADHRISIAFTTKQANKLFLIGVRPDGSLSILERTFPGCRGLWSDGQTLWVSTLYQLWRLENVLDDGQNSNGFDKVFVPQVGYTTGDVQITDLGVDSAGKAVFASSFFNCLATTDERHSLTPCWTPPFFSELASGDRCHLSGLAMENGRPKFATAFSQSNEPAGWRTQTATSGCVIDVASNQIVADGLSMPCMPRVYQDKLWLCHAGTGEFGVVDPASGQFESISFLPGYLSGLDLVDDCAVLGLSDLRETEDCPELRKRLDEKQAESRCSVQVVDLRSGDATHWLRIKGVVTEIGSVAVLPDTVMPMAIGFQSDEICRSISIGEPEGVSPRRPTP